MGIFSGLFKSRDKPQNRTAGSNYTFFMGGTTSGKTVTERSAMLMPALFNAVLIGLELSAYIGGGFLLNACYVALGELIVMLTFGSVLLQLFKKRNLAHILFHK